MVKMNFVMLMSGVDYFDDGFAINPFMNSTVAIDIDKARNEHETIKNALQDAGVKIVQVAPPKDCQDGVYTANWALVRGKQAVMSHLPNKRRAEEPYAEQVLRDLGKEIIRLPNGLRFSGQGDALPCGNDLFIGSTYRTDPEVHSFLKESLGFNVISLETKPIRRLLGLGPRITNKTTGWPDSFFYDIDLALAVIKFPNESENGLIAWCPDAFTKNSRELLANYHGVNKIEVSLQEAKNGFACNLVSTGETVIMSDKAPDLKSKLQDLGLKIITPEITELAKGGGYIRCTTLTLN